MNKVVSSRRATLNTIAAAQFAIYAIFSIFGFAGWIVSATASLEYGYISGHLERWTARLPIWGPIILIGGILSLVAANLLWKSKRLGGYLGILSFIIGLATNLIVASNLLVHAFVGALIGWILLVPLIAEWKNLKPHNT